ncbi:MAG: hypothetical protein OXF60_09315 [Gammaproteobacteria bacterium]|nr:hypothetical protein [Gammaproteobacteria bacterium]
MSLLRINAMDYGILQKPVHREMWLFQRSAESYPIPTKKENGFNHLEQSKFRKKQFVKEKLAAKWLRNEKVVRFVVVGQYENKPDFDGPRFLWWIVTIEKNNKFYSDIKFDPNRQMV